MILSCGEALIDMLPRETVAGEAAFVPYAGGAVFNTAIALGRLGAPSGFFTGLSTDLFGQILDRTLAASGVDTTLCARSARPTTLAFVTLRDGQATYAFYDENTAGRLLSTADLPALPTGIDTLFFGGISLGPQHTPRLHSGRRRLPRPDQPDDRCRRYRETVGRGSALALRRRAPR